MNYALLPTDIIHHIIEFDGKIKYRNGKYINQIPKNDERYSMLHNIKQYETIVCFNSSHCFTYLSPKKEYNILKSIFDNRIIYSFASYNSSYTVKMDIY
jgi:hypothetical protein